MEKVTYEVFIDSLKKGNPPENYPPAVQSIWHAFQNNWHRAHDHIDHLSDSNSCWVHAHLHRWEGDEWNARYWYRRANKSYCNLSLEEEREIILRALTNA